MSIAPIIGAAVCLVLAGEMEPVPPEPDLTRSTGAVALADWPFCNFLVLQTPKGFALAMWKSGIWFFEETDVVHGSLDGIGAHTIHVTGSVMSGEMTVDIEEAGTDLRSAQKAYYKRCKI
jgi:hypothetical protein